MQIFIAGFMPAAAFGAAAVAVAAAVVMNGAKLTGRLDRLPAGGKVWALWSEVLGMLGLVILPQVSVSSQQHIRLACRLRDLSSLGVMYGVPRHWQSC